MPMPVASALLLDLAPAERRQSVLALNYTSMSVAYTVAVMPAGYLAELGYGYLAVSTAIGYLLVAFLYLVFLGKIAVEKAPAGPQGSFLAFRDASFLKFAAFGFIFPFSMGLVVSASPLFAAENGVGEGYIGLVLRGDPPYRGGAARRHGDLQPGGGGVQLGGAGFGGTARAGGPPGGLPGRLGAGGFAQHGERPLRERPAARRHRLAHGVGRLRCASAGRGRGASPTAIPGTRPGRPTLSR